MFLLMREGNLESSDLGLPLQPCSCEHGLGCMSRRSTEPGKQLAERIGFGAMEQLLGLSGLYYKPAGSGKRPEER